MTLYILIAIASVAALAMIMVRTVLNAALCLMVCLLSIAGIYIVLNAEFLAIVQVLVYAGGILLLIIFGIMVTRERQDTRPVRQIPGLLMGILLTAALWMSLRTLDMSEATLQERTVNSIGVSLMTQFALPFEIGGLLILVSMIGAMITASFRKQRHES